MGRAGALASFAKSRPSIQRGRAAAVAKSRAATYFRTLSRARDTVISQVRTRPPLGCRRNV